MTARPHCSSDLRAFAERRWTRIPLALSRADLQWLDDMLDWHECFVQGEGAVRARIHCEVKAALRASVLERPHVPLANSTDNPVL